MMKAQTNRNTSGVVAALGICMIAAACGEVAGIDDGMGEVQVTLQEATAEALFQVVTADFAAAPEATAGRVPRELVRTLNVTVTGIQILPFCEEAGEGNGDGQCEDLWETLDLGDTTYDLDLLNLPSEDEDAVALAEGTVPIGEYHKIRLFVSDATVSFFEDVAVGHTTFLAYDADENHDPDDPNTDTVHPVEIPSVQNTGIKADIALEVTEETAGDVGLLFDADATFRNVIATGNGRVLVPPVLKARGMLQNQDS
jgi:hypothetical protein